MKKIVFNVIIVVYLLMVIFVTATLLAFNDHRITEFGNYSFVTLNEKFDSYNKSDLLIISNENNDSIEVSDNIIYYKKVNSKDKIELSSVKKINKTSSEVTYFTDSGDFVLEDDVIGTDNDVKAIPLIGSALGVIQSRWGYLFIVVLPISLGFIYELYAIVKEIKMDRKK